MSYVAARGKRVRLGWSAKTLKNNPTLIITLLTQWTTLWHHKTEHCRVITAVEYANTIRKSNSSRYDETTHIFTLFTNFYEKKTDIYEFFLHKRMCYLVRTGQWEISWLILDSSSRGHTAYTGQRKRGRSHCCMFQMDTGSTSSNSTLVSWGERQQADIFTTGFFEFMFRVRNSEPRGSKADVSYTTAAIT